LLGSSLEDEVAGLGESGLAGEEPQRARAADTNAAQPDLLYLKADEIDANPFQPRREFNESEIASLAESLKSHEMLAPVLVRQVNGRYQLISGERRLRAAIRAGWPTVPARLRKADDRLVAELAIVENVQRKDLNPIEKAMAFKRYIDEHSCTQDELAQRIKIDRSTIANLMRLLELPAAVLDALRMGGITAGHARALLPLGDESAQIAFSDRIQREGLSVRDTERQVQEMVFKEDSPPEVAGVKSKRAKRTTTQQVASLQQELRMALGTKVEIRQSSRGRGRIVIHFQNHEEFERMRELLTGSASRKTREAA
jgi:ParB family chromosome partitioning protein